MKLDAFNEETLINPKEKSAFSQTRRSVFTKMMKPKFKHPSGVSLEELSKEEIADLTEQLSNIAKSQSGVIDEENFISVMSDFVTTPISKLRLMFRSMDTHGKGIIQQTEINEFVLNQLSTGYTVEKTDYHFQPAENVPSLSRRTNIELLEVHSGKIPSDDFIFVCGRDNQLLVARADTHDIKVTLLVPDRSLLTVANIDAEDLEPSDIRQTRHFLRLWDRKKKEREEQLEELYGMCRDVVKETREKMRQSRSAVRSEDRRERRRRNEEQEAERGKLDEEKRGKKRNQSEEIKENKMKGHKKKELQIEAETRDGEESECNLMYSDNFSTGNGKEDEDEEEGRQMRRSREGKSTKRRKEQRINRSKQRKHNKEEDDAQSISSFSSNFTLRRSEKGNEENENGELHEAFSLSSIADENESEEEHKNRSADSRKRSDVVSVCSHEENTSGDEKNISRKKDASEDGADSFRIHVSPSSSPALSAHQLASPSALSHMPSTSPASASSSRPTPKTFRSILTPPSSSKRSMKPLTPGGTPSSQSLMSPCSFTPRGSSQKNPTSTPSSQSSPPLHPFVSPFAPSEKVDPNFAPAIPQVIKENVPLPKRKRFTSAASSSFSSPSPLSPSASTASLSHYASSSSLSYSQSSPVTRSASTPHSFSFLSNSHSHSHQANLPSNLSISFTSCSPLASPQQSSSSSFSFAPQKSVRHPFSASTPSSLRMSASSTSSTPSYLSSYSSSADAFPSSSSSSSSSSHFGSTFPSHRKSDSFSQSIVSSASFAISPFRSNAPSSASSALASSLSRPQVPPLHLSSSLPTEDLSQFSRRIQTQNKEIRLSLLDFQFKLPSDASSSSAAAFRNLSQSLSVELPSNEEREEFLSATHRPSLHSLHMQKRSLLLSPSFNATLPSRLIKRLDERKIEGKPRLLEELPTQVAKKQLEAEELKKKEERNKQFGASKPEATSSPREASGRDKKSSFDTLSGSSLPPQQHIPSSLPSLTRKSLAQTKSMTRNHNKRHNLQESGLIMPERPEDVEITSRFTEKQRLRLASSHPTTMRVWPADFMKRTEGRKHRRRKRKNRKGLKQDGTEGHLDSIGDSRQNEESDEEDYDGTDDGSDDSTDDDEVDEYTDEYSKLSSSDDGMKKKNLKGQHSSRPKPQKSSEGTKNASSFSETGKKRDFVEEIRRRMQLESDSKGVFDHTPTELALDEYGGKRKEKGFGYSSAFLETLAIMEGKEPSSSSSFSSSSSATANTSSPLSTPRMTPEDKVRAMDNHSPTKQPSSSSSAPLSLPLPLSSTSSMQSMYFLPKGHSQRGVWITCALHLPNEGAVLVGTNRFALIAYSSSDFTEMRRLTTSAQITTLSIAPSDCVVSFKEEIILGMERGMGKNEAAKILEQKKNFFEMERMTSPSSIIQRESGEYATQKRSPSLSRSGLRSGSSAYGSNSSSSSSSKSVGSGVTSAVDTSFMSDTHLVLAGDAEGVCHLFNPLLNEGPAQLVSHFKLHTGKITRMIVTSSHSFVSCSLDGTLCFVEMVKKQWEVVKTVTLEQNYQPDWTEYPCDRSRFIMSRMKVKADGTISYGKSSSMKGNLNGTTNMLASQQLYSTSRDVPSHLSGMKQPPLEASDGIVSKHGFTDMAVCKSKSMLIATTTRGQILIYNDLTGRQLFALDGHSCFVKRCFLDEQRQLLITVSVDKTIKLWSLQSLLLKQTVVDHSEYYPQNQYTAVAYDERRHILLTAGDKIKAWKLDITADLNAQKEKEKEERLKENKSLTGIGNSGIVDDSDDQGYSSEENGYQSMNYVENKKKKKGFSKTIYPTQSDEELMIKENTKFLLENSTKLSQTLKSFSTLSNTSDLSQIQSNTTTPIFSAAHIHPILSVLFSSAFCQIVSIDVSGMVCVWNVKTGNNEKKFSIHPTAPPLVCAALDGLQRVLVVADVLGNVSTWNFQSGEMLIHTPPRPKDVDEPDDRRKRNLRDCESLSPSSPSSSRSKKSQSFKYKNVASRVFAPDKDESKKEDKHLLPTPSFYCSTSSSLYNSPSFVLPIPFASSASSKTQSLALTATSLVSSSSSRSVRRINPASDDPVECLCLCVSPLWHPTIAVVGMSKGFMLNASIEHLRLNLGNSLLNGVSSSRPSSSSNRDIVIAARDVQPDWQMLNGHSFKCDVVDCCCCSRASGPLSLLFNEKGLMPSAFLSSTNDNVPGNGLNSTSVSSSNPLSNTSKSLSSSMRTNFFSHLSETYTTSSQKNFTSTPPELICSVSSDGMMMLWNLPLTTRPSTQMKLLDVLCDSPLFVSLVTQIATEPKEKTKTTASKSERGRRGGVGLDGNPYQMPNAIVNRSDFVRERRGSESCASVHLADSVRSFSQRKMQQFVLQHTPIKPSDLQPSTIGKIFYVPVLDLLGVFETHTDPPVVAVNSSASSSGGAGQSHRQRGWLHGTSAASSMHHPSSSISSLSSIGFSGREGGERKELGSSSLFLSATSNSGFLGAASATSGSPQSFSGCSSPRTFSFPSTFSPPPPTPTTPGGTFVDPFPLTSNNTPKMPASSSLSSSTTPLNSLEARKATLDSVCEKNEDEAKGDEQKSLNASGNQSLPKQSHLLSPSISESSPLSSFSSTLLANQSSSHEHSTSTALPSLSAHALADKDDISPSSSSAATSLTPFNNTSNPTSSPTLSSLSGSSLVPTLSPSMTPKLSSSFGSSYAASRSPSISLSPNAPSIHFATPSSSPSSASQPAASSSRPLHTFLNLYSVSQSVFVGHFNFTELPVAVAVDSHATRMLVAYSQSLLVMSPTNFNLRMELFDISLWPASMSRIRRYDSCKSKGISSSSSSFQKNSASLLPNNSVSSSSPSLVSKPQLLHGSIEVPEQSIPLVAAHTEPCNHFPAESAQYLRAAKDTSSSPLLFESEITSITVIPQENEDYFVVGDCDGWITILGAEDGRKITNVGPQDESAKKQDVKFKEDDKESKTEDFIIHSSDFEERATYSVQGWPSGLMNLSSRNGCTIVEEWQRRREIFNQLYIKPTT
eukprot:MONOS_6848.2-p1 / transcript=MONOS_6848.2 / gene=MONOS_6848 / organism=Monocercomonoides_exilis_PA203 / gene_product=unspecified product / transcript_product=unspecified product / location=Mono_scaffold00224:2329-12146(-) / protein_length=3002 / sequence_SO=supercontig / SO=protein_coding / is_pseudo=false